MTFSKALSVSALLAVAGAANAAVTGVTWRVVDNSVGNPGSDGFAGSVWNALNQYTFDLILQGDAGQRINGINMGDSAAPGATPYFISTNGTIFNHSFGGNTRSASFEAVPGFNAIQYDTFVALGSTAPGPGISFAGGASLTSPTMRATWFTTDNAVLDANGEMRILRVTVGLPSATDPSGQPFPYYLGTHHIPGFSPISSIEVGLPAGQLTSLIIPNALGPLTPPTPGTAALLGIAGVAGMRRRRN